MSVITQDFVAAGKPTYITANAGVMYTDITDGIVYKQTTIPYGKNWKVVSNQNVFIPSSGVTTVSATTPLASTGGNTPNITIQQAGPTQDGYLSSADWNTFNSGSGGAVTSVTATGLLTSSGGTTPDISSSVDKGKLVGRNSVTAGIMEEITVGGGLTLSGTTLSATTQVVGYEMNFLLMGG